MDVYVITWKNYNTNFYDNIAMLKRDDAEEIWRSVRKSTLKLGYDLLLDDEENFIFKSNDSLEVSLHACPLFDEYKFTDDGVQTHTGNRDEFLAAVKSSWNVQAMERLSELWENSKE